jgi:hypothetical protein
VARLLRLEGKTPVLERDQARRLFASLEGEDVLTRCDRALLAVMLYGFVRVGALVRLRACDFQDLGSTGWLVLQEKGGRERRLPAHHLVREDLRRYLAASGLGELGQRRAPLFQSAPRRAKSLSGSALDGSGVLAIVKRRCRAVGLPESICNHSFRASGITLVRCVGQRHSELSTPAARRDGGGSRRHWRRGLRVWAPCARAYVAGQQTGFGRDAALDTASRVRPRACIEPQQTRLCTLPRASRAACERLTMNQDDGSVVVAAHDFPMSRHSVMAIRPSGRCSEHWAPAPKEPPEGL